MLGSNFYSNQKFVVYSAQGNCLPWTQWQPAEKRKTGLLDGLRVQNGALFTLVGFFSGTWNLVLDSCLHFKLKRTLMIVLSFLTDLLKECALNWHLHRWSRWSMLLSPGHLCTASCWALAWRARPQTLSWVIVDSVRRFSLRALGSWSLVPYEFLNW